MLSVVKLSVNVMNVVARGSLSASGLDNIWEDGGTKNTFGEKVTNKIQNGGWNFHFWWWKLKKNINFFIRLSITLEVEFER